MADERSSFLQSPLFQAAARRQGPRRTRGVGAQSAKARHVEALAREGAFSKACSSPVSEVAEMTAEEQLRWAGQLLPGSTRPAAACSTHEAAADSGAAHALGATPVGIADGNFLGSPGCDPNGSQAALNIIATNVDSSGPRNEARARRAFPRLGESTAREHRVHGATSWRPGVPGSPLEVVRFPALSAAGPTAARPEHFREALAVRR